FNDLDEDLKKDDNASNPSSINDVHSSQLPEIDPAFSTHEVSICTPPHQVEKNKNVDKGQNEQEFVYGTDNESKEYDSEDEIDENIEDDNVLVNEDNINDKPNVE
nr:hypothetical protein [Tanacetum cinerariifolium]